MWTVGLGVRLEKVEMMMTVGVNLGVTLVKMVTMKQLLMRKYLAGKYLEAM